MGFFYHGNREESKNIKNENRKTELESIKEKLNVEQGQNG